MVGTTTRSSLVIFPLISAPAVRVALVLWDKVEILRRLAEEHFRDLDPVSGIGRGELEGREVSVSACFVLHTDPVPTRVSNSLRPRYRGGRSFIIGGIRSSNPIGTYRCWNDRASQRNRRAVLTPRVSAP